MIRRLFVLPLCALVLLFLVAAPGAQPSGTLVTGTVVDGALSPLAGASITLERQAVVVSRTTSDAEGRFTFQNVAPGDYRVRATHRSAPTLVREFRVAAGVAAVKLPLVMAPAVEVTAAAKTVDALGQSLPAPPPYPTVATSQRTPISGGVAAGRAGGGGVAPQRMYERVVTGQIYFEDRERYAPIDPNRFQDTRTQPLSTFGADVDTASYANVRRFLSSGQLPPSDAVRVEELLNYFHPDYAQPRNGRPMALTTEVADCPWAPSHKLVLVGARARAAAPQTREGRSIVLLIDVSGSMAPADRLPMLRTALGLFVDSLNPDDRLAIVTYAGSSGVALASTPVRRRDVIQRAIANLNASGSTNGAQGIVTAYRLAREAFIPGGVNRVMLATDGDFNVGVTNERDLVRLIERERESGVFLSIFGVGQGNLNDSALEQMANKGNGHYVYLDSLQEARRVLLHETDSTLETVAKDVKFQVEFNPAMVASWRLIGYENRLLADKDFNNDRKDGGEMGAGHTVTVLYEVVPVGVEWEGAGDSEGRPSVDPLKYQANPAVIDRPSRPANTNGDWLTVKARYKQPDGDVSALIEQSVRSGGPVRHLPFAAAVAEFGLMLRRGTTDAGRWDALVRRVNAITVSPALATDKAGFAELVETARGLARLQRTR